MPSYNASRFIAESINSVFLQAYSNWELLIVDDCSMDNSVRIAQKFVDIDKRVSVRKECRGSRCPECCYRTGKRAIYRFFG